MTENGDQQEVSQDGEEGEQPQTWEERLMRLLLRTLRRGDEAESEDDE